MPPHRPSPGDDDGPVEAALADYFELVDRGERVELTSLMAAHPGCEAELRQFLRHERRIHTLVAESGAAELSPARTIGDFRLIRELGRGGMGVVYEAEQLSLGRRVALKVLLHASGVDSLGRTRFRNETEILARLRHPHIVDVFMVGEEDGAHYYAMELIEGGDANALIDDPASPASLESRAAGSTLPPGNEETAPPCKSSLLGASPSQPHRSWLPAGDRCRGIATLTRQIADSLSHAHASGVLHRDVKPSNILVDRRGMAFLSDFGLARIRGQETLTELGDLVGTLRYVAPEIVNARTARADERSDVYALGASLWEMLAGRRLFDGGERGSLVRRILDEQPEAPSRGRRDVPHDLETIALCALAKEPDRRYQSAGEMRDDLDRFLAKRPIAARRTSPTERALLWALRNRRLAFTLAASIVLLACGATIAALLIASARQETIVALEQSRDSEGMARQQSVAAAASEQAVRRMLYATHMAMAGAAWKAGETSQARMLLERHAVTADSRSDVSSDPRGFEWHFLARQLRLRSEALHRGDNALYAIVKSPDRRHFVTAGRDSIVRWHDLSSGRVTRSMTTHQSEINCIGFSPSGRLFATGGDDGTIKIWNAVDLTLRRTVPFLGTKVFYVAFLADDDHVVCGGEGAAHLLIDVATGNVDRLLVGPEPPARGPTLQSAVTIHGCVSPSSRWLITTRQIRHSTGIDGVDLWNLDNGERREILSVNQPLCVLCDVDEEISFVASIGKLHVIDMANGRILSSTKLIAAGGPLALSPDRRRLVMGAPNGELAVWDVRREPDAASLTLIRRLPVHDSEIFDVEFELDGVSVLSVGRDGTVHRTDVDESPSLDRELVWARGRTLTPIPDSRIILADRPLALCDRETGRTIRHLADDKLLGSAASGDGRFVAAAFADGLRVWNCQDGLLVYDQTEPSKTLVACRLSFAGPHSLMVSRQFLDKPRQSLEAFDVRSRGAAAQIAWNQTEWMFSCCDDGFVFREFDPESVVCLEFPSGRIRWRRPPFEDYARKAAISRDGRWLIASDTRGRAIMLFDCRTGDVKFRLPCQANALALAVSEDGKSFFVGDANGVVSIWSLEYGQKLFDLATFEAPIEQLCFADGALLARVSRTIKGRKTFCWHQFGID